MTINCFVSTIESPATNLDRIARFQQTGCQDWLSAAEQEGKFDDADASQLRGRLLFKTRRAAFAVVCLSAVKVSLCSNTFCCGKQVEAKMRRP
jgi:hypothetical protein